MLGWFALTWDVLRDSIAPVLFWGLLFAGPRKRFALRAGGPYTGREAERWAPGRR